MKRGLFGDESVKFEEDQDRPIRDHISRVAKACADRPADGLHVGAIMDRLGQVASTGVIEGLAACGREFIDEVGGGD